MDTVTILKAVTTVEDCEDAWDELVDTDVTSTLETTIIQRGSGSAKIDVNAPAGAGDILATEDMTALDLSGDDTIAYWIYSTTALDAGDLQILIDEDVNCASPSESLDVPATSANTWTRHTGTYVAASSTRNAIISVGLKMIVDKGAFTVYLDDVISGSAKTFNVLDVVGFDRGESTAAWPGAGIVPLLDGTLDKKPSRMRRDVTVRFHVFDSEADLNWLEDAVDFYESIRLIYNKDEVEGVPPDGGFHAERAGGFSQTLLATLNMPEKVPLWSKTVKPPTFS